jgi:hypothetical protein
MKARNVPISSMLAWYVSCSTDIDAGSSSMIPQLVERVERAATGAQRGRQA